MVGHQKITFFLGNILTIVAEGCIITAPLLILYIYQNEKNFFFKNSSKLRTAYLGTFHLVSEPSPYGRALPNILPVGIGHFTVTL